MEKKRINVLLYKGIEKIIELNQEDYSAFESFMKKIKDEFEQTETYQLMAMNSSEQFLILTQDNYIKVLNENIPEGLKLFMSQIVKTSDGIITQDEENKKKTNEENDDDFVIEKENINIEQEKTKNEVEENENKIEGNNIIINNNSEKINEGEDDNNYVDSGYKSVVLRGESNLENKNQENNFDIKLKNIFGDEEEENYYIKNKYILTSKNIDKKRFNNEKCTICKVKLKGIKYICCICAQCSLCEECELYHNHPCFKYKTNFISSLYDTCEFMNKYYEFKIPYESTLYSKYFRKEYDLKIEPYSDLQFSLRPNKVINIPIKILNYYKETLDSNQFIILCKNQKNIYLSPDKENIKIKETEHILNIKCITPDKTCGKENIFIEIYSSELPIKSSRRLIYEYIIEVNYDLDDDKLNMELKNDESIYCFNKEHKRIALKLLKLSGNEYKIKNIFNCLLENNWDSNKALKALKKRKK